MKKEGIQVVELSAERIAQLLDHAKAVFSQEDYRALDNLVSSFFLFRDLLRDEKMTVKQLRKLIFGPKTEKLSKIIEKMEKDGEGPTAASDGTGAPAEVTAEGDEKIQQGDSAAETKRKGHGRNGADAYEGAEVVVIDHESLKPRDPCPEPGCTGRLYQLAQPKVLVRVAGQAPLGAKVIELQQLRCNLCLKVFTAKEPEGLGEEKYDETAGSMIGLLRYGTGVPFNRLEGLQDNLGIPLPTSTQWDIVERAARRIALTYAERRPRSSPQARSCAAPAASPGVAVAASTARGAPAAAAASATAAAFAEVFAQVARLRETMAWVADKLRRLEALPPHAWDRSTLRALYHALEDSPRIGGRGHTGEGRKGAMNLRGARPRR